MDLFYFSSFIFKNIRVSLKKSNLSEKKIREEELETYRINLDLYSSMKNVGIL